MWNRSMRSKSMNILIQALIIMSSSRLKSLNRKLVKWIALDEGITILCFVWMKGMDINKKRYSLVLTSQ